MRFYFLLLFFAFYSLSWSQETILISDLLKGSPSITGKAEYLSSPFVTAGNRLYVVGHQDGSFPEIGWHIPGEMGGIWNHPIKLFDGFDATIISGQESLALNSAKSFINYPTASQHKYEFPDHGLLVERWQFVPDDSQSIGIQYQIRNTTRNLKKLNFIFKAFSDLRPTWLGERTGMKDAKDKAIYNTNQAYYIIKDSLNPWYAVIRSDIRLDQFKTLRTTYKGQGTGVEMGYEMKVKPNTLTSITFYISGSYKSSWEALQNNHNIRKNLTKEIEIKQQRYKEIANNSRLNLEDEHLQQTFEWLKYNSAWLVQEVPEIGKGITAGIPDYPWWFGVDSEYAAKGLLAAGMHEPVFSTIRLLDSVSSAVNGNGRIIHEMSTNGAVFNKGNINETPQFASLIWEAYKWTGNRNFLQNYFPAVVDGLEWLMNENDSNGNLFPDGFGMMEIHGLDSEMIDVAAYTQRAFEDAASMSSELGRDSLSQKYQATALELKKKINKEFWSEEFGSYADFIGTDDQALKLIEEAIVRADTLDKPWSVKELEKKRAYIKKSPSSEPRPFVLHHNWVVNTPMEMKIADSAKALVALRKAEKYTNPFGMFVTGIDRDEKLSSTESSFKGSKAFSYTGAVMTLPTGVQAVAENNYGNPDMALAYLEKMVHSFSYAFPGGMYEVSPDYGMMVQAWNIYSFAVPIVNQFFGIDPMAGNKTITIRPQFPTAWDTASLENVKVGDNSIHIYYLRNEEGMTLKISQMKTDWTLNIILPEDEYSFQGKAVQKTQENKSVFITSDATIEIVKNI